MEINTTPSQAPNINFENINVGVGWGKPESGGVYRGERHFVRPRFTLETGRRHASRRTAVGTYHVDFTACRLAFAIGRALAAGITRISAREAARCGAGFARAAGIRPATAPATVSRRHGFIAGQAFTGGFIGADGFYHAAAIVVMRQRPVHGDLLTAKVRAFPVNHSTGLGFLPGFVPACGIAITPCQLAV